MSHDSRDNDVAMTNMQQVFWQYNEIPAMKLSETKDLAVCT